MTASFTSQPQVAGFTGVDGVNKDKIVHVGALQVGSSTLVEADVSALDGSSALIDQAANGVSVGVAGDGEVAAADGVSTVVERFGSFFKIAITLTALRVQIEDGAASGSFGAVPLFTFADIPSFIHLSRQDYATVTESVAVVFTADVDGSTEVLTNVSDFTDLYVGRTITGVGIAASSEIVSMDEELGTITLSEATTVADTAVELTQTALTGATDGDFEIGLGTTEIVAAADGVLAAGNENIGADVDVVAEVVAAVGSDTTAEYVAAEGTVYLNVSGTAATIDAFGHVDVTGNIVIVGVMLDA
jgi:hypothetical protein